MIIILLPGLFLCWVYELEIRGTGFQAQALEIDLCVGNVDAYRDKEIDGLSLPLPAVIVDGPARPVFVEVQTCQFTLRQGLRLEPERRALE